MDEKLIIWEHCLVLSLILFPAFAGFPSELAHEKYQQAQSGNVSRENQTGFISIDCGATEDYVDNQTGIFYESDSKYIDSGTVSQTSISAPGPLFPFYQRQQRTLRSFPDHERNCYTLRPEKGRNNKYLIRTVFSYTEDSPPPVFDLYLGVNRLGTVISSRLMEIIYVPTEDEVELCLVKTGHGDPYITALELRPLDNSIYPVQEGVLKVVSRVDFGGVNKFTRFPEDAYDRIWIPDNLDRGDLITFPDQGKWSRKSVDSSLPIGRSEIDAYALPDSLLRSAVQTNNISISLNFGNWAGLIYLDSNQSLYAYFHFMEIERPEPGKKRELSINSYGTSHNLTSAFLLEYLKPLTVMPNDQPNGNIPVNYSTPPFLPVYSVVAAEGSTLPPILNGAEMFLLNELPFSPTNHDDVNAMMETKQMYRVTRNWNGDPCLPSFLSWDGVTCSNDSRIPRVISLNLSSSGLTGHISYSIYKLRELQSMDLSYNNLTGQVPDFFEDMPNLKVLNLTGNNLRGSIPAALVQKIKDGTLILRADGNPELCQLLSCQEKKTKKMISPIVATIVAVLAALFLSSMVFLCIFAAYIKKSHGEIPTRSNKEEGLQLKNRTFTYKEIVQITGNFRTVIGEGGFGKVYLGTLTDDTPVAVKLLSESSNQGHKEFRSEAQLLMVVHHRNLVSLSGYCDEGEHMALIYEYMTNGNLKQQLSVSNTNVLTWNERLQIAADAAQGLEYLHNGCKPPIVHRDLKPSNILLNESMQAKIADFGLSRFFTSETASHMTTTPAGTLGYLDPEFHASGSLSKKSDVYSFGIILLEIITGRPAVMRQQGENIYIIPWINHTIEAGDICSIVDPRLQGEFNTNSAWRAVEVAMLCIGSVAARRPDMSYVLAELKECAALDLMVAPATTQRTHNNISAADTEMLAPRVR